MTEKNTNTDETELDTVTVKLFDASTEHQKQLIKEECDAFWVYGPEIVSHESCAGNRGRMWVLEGDPGFATAFEKQQKIPTRCSVVDTTKSRSKTDTE